MAREIGLHVRGNQTLTALFKKVLRLELPIFQCFLRQQSGVIIPIQEEEIAQFRVVCERIDKIFVHASYRINLAEQTFNQHPALKQELYWAQKLGCTHIVLHPGAAQAHDKGIDAIVKSLNNFIKTIKKPNFVLENVAFGSPSIGGSLEDLQKIREKLDEPERCSFCIDTAHAYTFGYDITSEQGRDNFINSLGQTLGFENIALIHINDTQSNLNSHHDAHCRLGAGNLGIEALKTFALDKRLKHIPLILELPAIDEIEEKEDLAAVRSWHNSPY